VLRGKQEAEVSDIALQSDLGIFFRNINTSESSDSFQGFFMKILTVLSIRIITQIAKYSHHFIV